MSIIVNGTVADASKAFQKVFDQLEAIGLKDKGPQHLTDKRPLLVQEKMLNDVGLSNNEIVFSIGEEEFTANISPEFLTAASTQIGDELLARISYDDEAHSYVIEQAINLSRPTYA